MKKDSTAFASRRDFLQFAVIGAGAGAGVLATPLDAEAQPKGAPRTLSGEASAAEPAWQLGPIESNVTFASHQETLDLNGKWSVTALGLEVQGERGYAALRRRQGEAMAAQVPGEIHLDLMRAGKLEDPNIGDHARTRCRWPEKFSWWYRTEFQITAGMRGHLQQRLILEGIDLCGEIFLNGKLIGSTQNAFATTELDVKDALRDGLNELVVRVTSGMEGVPAGVTVPREFAGRKLDAELRALYGARSFVFEDLRQLRKPAYSAYGWDFCDPLPNIGIWKGVRLEGRSQVVIRHLRLDTAIGGSDVSLEGEILLENLHPWSELQAVLEVRVEPPEGAALVQHLVLGAQPGLCLVPCRIVIPDAQLWWPNGMGAQPLYRLTARVVCDGNETDRCAQTLGLRTIEVDRSPLPDGSRFGFKVNGQPVYCKGANWAPADLIPARIDPARYQKLVAEARAAHFTMLRVNACGLYESDDFYDACDRAGILVWQDFTFTVALYPDSDPQFLASVREEAQSAVRRLRHHASLALWCGNNECTTTMAGWKKPSGARIYNELLPEICNGLDPGRCYWPGSPCGGIDPNSETSGDVHGWKEGTAITDDAAWSRFREIADEGRGRFFSEYYCGMSPPQLVSIREYLNDSELRRDSRGWKVHTEFFEALTHGCEKGIRAFYGSPDKLSLQKFVLYSQMVQAQLHGNGLEATRFRKDDPENGCQGALFWSYNDTWGEVGWSIIDHYLRRKAGYYWVKRAAAPVKVLVRAHLGQLVTRVVNDTLRSYSATVRLGWMRVDGTAKELQEYSLSIPANGVADVARAPVPQHSERDPREWLYAAVLSGEGFPDDQSIWLLAPHRALVNPRAAVSVAVHGDMLEVRSSVYAHGVHLDGEGSALDDNYFDLLPGIPLRVRITDSSASRSYSFATVEPIASLSEPKR